MLTSHYWEDPFTLFYAFHMLLLNYRCCARFCGSSVELMNTKLKEVMDKEESACVLSWIQLCNPVDSSLPGCSVHESFQARLLGWVARLYYKGSSWIREQIRIFCLGRRILYRWATREDHVSHTPKYKIWKASMYMCINKQKEKISENDLITNPGYSPSLILQKYLTTKE